MALREELCSPPPADLSLLLTLALFVLIFVGRAALPTYTLSSAADLPPGLKPLSDQELALSAIKSSETLFQVLASLLATLLLTWLGWWREAGFNRPSRWRNLHLLPFPLLVSALTFLGGVEVPGPAFLASAMFVVFVAAFGEEVLYRGIMWRALMPKGLLQTVMTTSLLYGILHLGRFVSARPWSEAVYLAMLAICSGFAYAALLRAHHFDLACSTVSFCAQLSRRYLDS